MHQTLLQYYEQHCVQRTDRKADSILSLDFSSAFYRISHADLLSMLRAYGCNVQIIGFIHSVYENAIAKIQINDHC
jgi:hypothetical protein